MIEQLQRRATQFIWVIIIIICNDNNNKIMQLIWFWSILQGVNYICIHFDAATLYAASCVYELAAELVSCMQSTMMHSRTAQLSQPKSL